MLYFYYAEVNKVKKEKRTEAAYQKTSINDKLNKKSDFKIYELILFAVLIMIASSFLTIVIMKEMSSSGTVNNKVVTRDEELAEFEEVYNLINDSYYKEVNKKDLVNGAINGMLSSLKDPHTSYFSKIEAESFNELMNGSYKGIGAEISLDSSGNIFILSVFKNSPASEVGLKFNDVILEVNGKNTSGLTTTEVVALIKDVKVSKAHIKVSRGGQILEFDVERRNVIIESVESDVISKNGKKIGYVTINTFANNTYEQFRKNIEDLEKENIEGLVIDVRGNSGGYLHSATNMINMFLPKGKVIYQIADRNTTYKYTATTDESRNYPVAVLVNKSSASASEILAISLKESYEAYVVGTFTYGKGTVQTTKDLASGGMIKYTIQKWLSPKGNWVNAVGVEPTHQVDLSKDYDNNPTLENDNQFQKALDLVSNKK